MIIFEENFDLLDAIHTTYHIPLMYCGKKLVRFYSLDPSITNLGIQALECPFQYCSKSNI